LPRVLKKLSNNLAADVLPALRLLNLECKVQKFLKKKQLLVPFVEKRQIVGRPPLTIVRTRKEFERLLTEMEGGYP